MINPYAKQQRESWHSKIGNDDNNIPRFIKFIPLEYNYSYEYGQQMCKIHV